MRGRLNSERGSALLIALMLIAMLTLIGVLSIENSTTDVELSYNCVNADRAFYVAEAGAKQAYALIQADPTWRAGYNNESFGNGQFTVTIVDSSTNAALVDSVVITSTGRVLEAEAAVELTLTPNQISPFGYAMFAEDAVDIRNSMNTDSYNSDSGSYALTRDTVAGDIGSNGTIQVYNGALIAGNVSTSDPGALDIKDIDDILGDTTSTAPEQHLPLVPAEDWVFAEANNDNLTGISGTYSYDPVTDAFQSTGNVILSSGVYYFSDIILKNSAQLSLAPGAEVTIYVTGDIELKNSSAVNIGGAPSDLLILSQGDIVLKNSGDIFAAFYAPEGNADLRNSGEFYGSIVATDIIAHNSARFHYDRQLGSIKWNSDDEMKPVAWREL